MFQTTLGIDQHGMYKKMMWEQHCAAMHFFWWHLVCTSLPSPRQVTRILQPRKSMAPLAGDCRELLEYLSWCQQNWTSTWKCLSLRSCWLWSSISLSENHMAAFHLDLSGFPQLSPVKILCMYVDFRVGICGASFVHCRALWEQYAAEAALPCCRPISQASRATQPLPKGKPSSLAAATTMPHQTLESSKGPDPQSLPDSRELPHFFCFLLEPSLLKKIGQWSFHTSSTLF